MGWGCGERDLHWRCWACLAFWGFLTIESLKSLFEGVLVRDACGWGHWESESPPEALGVHSASGSSWLTGHKAISGSHTEETSGERWRETKGALVLIPTDCSHGH